jgi:hypothetical protein
MMTVMVIETSVQYVHQTRLIAREDYIKCWIFILNIFWYGAHVTKCVLENTFRKLLSFKRFSPYGEVNKNYKLVIIQFDDYFLRNFHLYE